MSADSETNNPLSSSVHALKVDVVVERILSLLDKHPDDLLNYRLVCHKWNDIIVGKIKGTGRSFKIPLRYEPHIPQFINESVARRRSREVLDTVIRTLTGTAARLHFDSLIIDRDFYLAGVMTQLKEFLEIQGQFIQHIKIKIRPGEYPKENENHVIDCEEVVTMGNIRVLLHATPNLQSWNFCVRFSDYNDGDRFRERNSMRVDVIEQRCIYSNLKPQLKNLTELKIKEPEGVHYSVDLIRQLISLPTMPSKLKSLKIKPWKELSNFALAIEALKPGLQDSLTELCITNARIDTKHSFVDKFSILTCLTSLTLNKICGDEKYGWIRSLLLAYSNLKTLVLGQEKPPQDCEDEEWILDNTIDEDEDYESVFPSVMASLEHLEINFTEFNGMGLLEHVRVESYETQFPSLNTLRITGCREGLMTMLDFGYYLLPGVGGNSQTLENFYLVGDFDEEEESRQMKLEILEIVSFTFPNARTWMNSE